MADTEQEKETKRDPEGILRCMLNTPPKPQKDITKGGRAQKPCNPADEKPSRDSAKD